MNDSRRRSEQKADSILRAASELFRTYGFKKVTISDIAREAGVSHVTVFNHFGSKEQLIREVVKAQVVAITDRYRAILEGEGSFPDKLERIVFDKTETVGQFQGQLARMAYQSNPEMRDFISSVWQRDVDQLTRDLLNLGRSEGYVDGELSDEALSLYLQILRQGIAANSGSLRDISSDASAFRDLNRLILYGLLGKRT